MEIYELMVLEANKTIPILCNELSLGDVRGIEELPKADFYTPFAFAEGIADKILGGLAIDVGNRQGIMDDG